MIRQALAPAPLLLAILVALAPLPFGGVLPRDRAVLAAVAFLAFAVSLVAQRERAALVELRVPLLALAGIGVFGLLQALSWPDLLARLLFAEGREIWLETRTITGAAAGGIPLSLAPEASRDAALQWLAAAAACAAAALVGRWRGARRLIAAAFLAVAVFEVVYGADNWFRSSDHIWGTLVPGDPTRLRGTFVNPDHFGFFIALAVAATHAWLWWAFRRLSQRQRLERSLLLLALPAFAFVTFFAGLAFTGSRAAFVAVAVAIVVQAVVLAAHYRRWQAAVSGVVVLALGAGAVALFGLQAGVGRWMETSAFEIGWGARMRVARASLELLARFPWTGTGLGTFGEAFARVQPSDLEGTWSHAHDDVLELLVTTGLVGLPLLVVGAIVLCRRLWTVVDRGRRSEERAAGLAACGALAVALTHSFFDFALTLPANFYLLVVLCGLAAGSPALSDAELAARRVPRRRRRPEPPSPEPRSQSPPAP